jgi:hypothetical protein
MLNWNVSADTCICACENEPAVIPSSVDSIFQLQSQETYTCANKHKEKTFLAANFRTIAHSVNSVTPLILQYYDYAKLFSFAHRWEKVDAQLVHTGKDAYYFEVHAPLSRNWAIVYVDTVMASANETTIYFSQIVDETLNSRYRQLFKSWVNVENRNCRIVLRAKQTASDSTHMCFAMLTTPTVSIPLWLYRLAIGWVLPSMIKDVDKELTRKTRQNAGAR